jgi:hypothetical protein
VVTDAIGMFVNPARVFSRQEVLAHPSPVPAEDGVYGWWFRRLPPLVDAARCCRYQDLALLYAGISPDVPRKGRLPSKGNLLERIKKTHYTGNAEGSTLRKSLGCLLADELGIQLRRVGSGKAMTFAEGEQALDAWMAENAYVSWVVRSRPWELEDYLIAALTLPLNLKKNTRSQFYPVLSAARRKCIAQANDLPILPVSV